MKDMSDPHVTRRIVIESRIIRGIVATLLTATVFYVGFYLAALFALIAARLPIP